MNCLWAYAISESGKQQYPKLLKALAGLRDMVGLEEVKESIADDIKTVLAFDLLDKPQRTTPVRTRSCSKRKQPSETGKRKRSSLARSNRGKAQPLKNSELEIESQGNCVYQTTLEDFLQRVQDCADDESEYEPDNVAEKSIRTKRMKDIKLHTLLLGSPGTGKTTLAAKLGKIWEALGLVNDKFVYVTKGDIISKWQGAALENMKNLVSENANGVIFIDEAYSLVSDSKDSYGSAILHYIVHSMTNPECTTTFIMAGYEEMVKNNLFGANEGLNRRFHSVFVLQKPSMVDMVALFENMCKRQKGWKCIVCTVSIMCMLKDLNDSFKDAGGDIEDLVLCTYKAHVNRFFPKPITQRITQEDIARGIEIYMRNKNKKKVSTSVSYLYS